MEDPDKKILDWCGHLAVPRLVDEKAYDRCKGCAAKIGGLMGAKHHHCRLCGHMFCSACTAKYHVPLIFRIKNKDGPTRVCHGCVEGCMAEKARAEGAAAGGGDRPGFEVGTGGSALSAHTVSASLASMARAVEIAPPAEWEEEAAFVQCPKCSAKKCKTHNCRVCGKLFCDKCTSKLDIPACFERKKGKTGPSRCCDACRFRIMSGAKLVEKLSPAAAAAQGVKKAPPPPPSPSGSMERRASRSFVKCSAGGCFAMAAAGENVCPAHGGGSRDSSSSSDAQPPLTLSIKREGSAVDDVLLTLSVPSVLSSAPASASEVDPMAPTLAWVDAQFKKLRPQSEGFEYVFRGQPVPEVFWRVILARQLGGTLLIRSKRRHELASVDGLAAGIDPVAGLGAISEDEVPANNPFKRSNAPSAKSPPPPPPPKKKPEPVRAWRRPTSGGAGAGSKHASIGVRPVSVLVGGLGPSNAAAGGKKPPPPPPGGKAPPPPPLPQTGDEMFRQRAKRLFGAQ